jgi:hypothetical protein
MTPVVITDLTRMSGTHICIAGYSLEANRPVECIRPEFRYEPLTEPWLYSAEGVLRPFAIADFTLIESRPAPPHTEDWIVDRRYKIPCDNAPHLVEPVLQDTCSRSVRELYGGAAQFDRSWYVPPNTGTRSLGTIRPERVSQVIYRWRPERSKWEYRLIFDDAEGDRFQLSVTDLAIRYLLDHWRLEERVTPKDAANRLQHNLRDGRDIYLRLGLTRPFGDEPRCYLQVTGVHTVPDYLDGRCHADFYRGDESERPVIVPF